ncbi:MAG: hypothetical protein ACPL7K_06575 [Armatimonadota bacterium]
MAETKECFGSILDRMHTDRVEGCRDCELMQQCMNKAVEEFSKVKECFGSALERMETDKAKECRRCRLLQQCMGKAVWEAEESSRGGTSKR